MFIMISRIPDLLNQRGMTVSDLHTKMQQNEFTELSCNLSCLVPQR